MLKGKIIKKFGKVHQYIYEDFDYWSLIKVLNLQEYNKEIEDEDYLIYLNNDKDYNVMVSEQNFETEEELEEIVQRAADNIQEGFINGDKFVERIIPLLFYHSKDRFTHAIDILTYSEGLDAINKYALDARTDFDVQYAIFDALAEIKRYRDLSESLVPSHA